MKLYTIKAIGLLSFITLAEISCKKHNEETPIPEVTFIITSPIQNISYNHNDTVYIKADITGPIEMHGYTWEIKNTANGTVLATGNMHSHSKTYKIDDKWVNNVSDKTDAELLITTEIDHDGNTATKDIHFVLLP